MESTEHDLIELERARLAPYEASARDPLWIWPIIGVMVFAYLASWTFEPVAIPIAVTVLYAAGLGGLIGYMTKRRGVQPPLRINQMPASLRRELFIFWGASIIGGLVVAAMQAWLGWVAAGALAGLAITVGGVVYHQRYRARVAELTSAL